MPEGTSYPILIVDDDPTFLKLLQRHLTSAGWAVMTATDGVQAMQVLLAEGPPVIITDWMMPKMDGLELCRAIRAHEGIRYAYVIILTAHSNEDRIVEAFEAGADDYLSKPFNRKELLVRLRAGERIVRLQRDLDARHREVHRANAEQAVANARLAEVNARLNRMATHDELTGLVNRREALTRLAEHWASACRHKGPMACIMLDIDHFKSRNDAYGHAVGDQVLKETAACLRRSVRSGESLCRVGGEEFLVICPQATEAMAAKGAERLRQAVEDQFIRCDDIELRITVSLGVAERTPEMNGPDDLLRAADTALFAAKDQGRNRVCIAGTQQEEGLVAHDSTSRLPGAGKPRASALADSAQAKAGGSLGTVLVVDDDGAARALCRTFLEREGYQVNEAVDGVDALQQVQIEKPDVIIMDVCMSNMDGLECTRRLKERTDTRDIPVIIASARTDGPNLAAAPRTEGDEYLTKPFPPLELLHRVRSMRRLQRSRIELQRANAARGEQSRAMTRLSELCCNLAAAESLDAVLEETVAAAAEMTCCQRVSIMLPDTDREFLTIARAIGIDATVASRVRVPTGGATAGKVFLTGEAVVVNAPEDVRDAGEEYDAPFFVSIPLVSQILKSSGRKVGVLNVTGRQGRRPFDPLALDYVQLIANIASAAIEDCLLRYARDQARDSIVIALAKLAECRNADTGRHVERVTRFSVLLGRQLQTLPRYSEVINDSFLGNLERSVPLHDIGKVAVPDRILNKPGPLTPEETTLMRTHAERGADTIRSVLAHSPGASFLDMAEEIARGHHEWYNGQGYPQGTGGDAIPLSARIVAVADVYDALTTQRVYKDAIPHNRAIAIIVESSGVQFDPDLVDALRARADEFKRLGVELADPPGGDGGSEGVATAPQTVQAGIEPFA